MFVRKNKQTDLRCLRKRIRSTWLSSSPSRVDFLMNVSLSPSAVITESRKRKALSNREGECIGQVSGACGRRRRESRVTGTAETG